MPDQDHPPPDRSLSSLAVLAAALLTVGSAGCQCGSVSQPARPAEQSANDEPPLLVDGTESAHVDFVQLQGHAGSYFFPEIMAAGAALLDYDQDGDLDIYLTNAAVPSSDLSSAMDGDPHAGNRLYRQDAPARFTDVTSDSGLADTGFGMGVAVGDVNNDGYPDVYVTNYGPDRLYLNRRDGTFTDITRAAGIDNLRWGASASFVDFDRDGWLDLFVTNYVDYYPAKKCFDPRGQRDYCGPQMFAGTADKLFRNDTGRGSSAQQEVQDEPAVHFLDVSLETGIAQAEGAGLGVLCADFTGDAWPDIFVANDGVANFLWVNGRDGTFRDEAILRGCAYDERGTPQGSMGVALGDVGGDGRNELFVTNLAGETNSLYDPRDVSGFRDAVVAAALAAPSFAHTGFGAAFADLDHDGDLDLLVANGRVKRPLEDVRPPAAEPSERPFWSIYGERNQIFLNEGQGRFRSHTSSRDGFTSPVEVSRALAMGDVDNDGDWDVLVANVAGPARLLRNEAERRGGWLVVRTVDPRWGGRDAYGAVVTVTAGSRRWQRLVQPGFSYLSSSDPRVHFGLGEARAVDRIEVRWPDGVAEVFSGGEVNQFRVLARGDGQPLEGQ